MIKRLVKLTIEIIVLVIIGIIIKDNFYVISNKIEYLYKKYIQPDIRQTLIDNEYRKKENYEYVKIYEDTTIKNLDDAKNAIYTFLDAGWDEYTVVCDADYLNCITDVKAIVENKTYITDLSNFVHPFNTFNKINTSFSSTGKIILKKEERYNEEQINFINSKIEEIYNNNYDSSKNLKENIKIFHDYIINNTKYDSSNQTGASDIPSSTAYGVLKDGIGICSGYSDVMSLLLDKLGAKNYRISSNSHVWNLVYVEGTWLHLDVTWDDPITSDGSNIISDKYFLIDNNTLSNNSAEEHVYNKEIYKEAQ